MGKYKHKRIYLNIKYSTYLKLRRNFPAQRGETMVSYFERLAKRLEYLNEN